MLDIKFTEEEPGVVAVVAAVVLAVVGVVVVVKDVGSYGEIKSV